MAGLLTCSELPKSERLQAFYSTVAASVLWCAGCWVPSVAVQNLLSCQENRWLRRMCCQRKPLDKPWVDWLRAGKRQGHRERCAAGLAALWHRAASAVHGWAGHLARRPDGHPARDVVRWRCGLWWRMMQAAGAGSSGWRHPRQNWRTGWEKVLCDTYTADWWGEPSRREMWLDWRGAFVRDWVSRWGGPRVCVRV